MIRLGAALALVLAACIDGAGVGAALPPADTVFVTAHLDDDLIFMQPEVADELVRGHTTTVYVTSGDPLGLRHAHKVYGAAMVAYQARVGASISDWQCGQIEIAGLPAHHCRLASRAISLVGLDVAEGGRYNERLDGLTHLLEGKVDALPLLGTQDGRVTVEQLIAELAAILDASQPSALHILDYAGSHGDDHPGHMASAAFALWAAARSSYRGPITSHRGYSVAGAPETLDADELGRALPMIRYFDACYFGCAACGTPCAMPDKSHVEWTGRQYASTTTFAVGALAAEDGRCVAVVGGALALAACDAPGVARLDGDGQLVAGTACIASGDRNADPLVLGACDGRPAARWLVDSEGGVWSAAPPQPTGEDMSFDHARCLAAEPLGAPVCGSRFLARWRVVP